MKALGRSGARNDMLFMLPRAGGSSWLAVGAGARVGSDTKTCA
jgi:hypothetical protein